MNDKSFILQEIIPILRNDLNLLRQKLADTTDIDELGFTISSEAWANHNGVALGALSFLKKPSDDAIELTIDVQQKGEIIKVWMGIYWSDGRVIQDIAEMDILDKKSEEIRNAEIIFMLEKFLENNNQKAINTLLNFLKQQVIGEN